MGSVAMENDYSVLLAMSEKEAIMRASEMERESSFCRAVDNAVVDFKKTGTSDCISIDELVKLHRTKYGII